MPWWKPEMFLTCSRSETCRGMCSQTKPEGISLVSVVSVVSIPKPRGPKWRATMWLSIWEYRCVRVNPSDVRDTRGGVSVVAEVSVTQQRTSEWDSKRRGPMIVDPGVPRTSPLGDESVLEYPSWIHTRSGVSFEAYMAGDSSFHEDLRGILSKSKLHCKRATWWLMSKLPSIHHVQNLTKERSEYTRNGVLSAPDQ